MDWQSLLVSTYLIVCDLWREDLFIYTERRSNNDDPALTDEEVLTIFLYAVMKGRRDLKSVYRYANDHLHEWFPHLNGYEAFVYRLNRLSETLPIFLEALLKKRSSLVSEMTGIFRIIDSCPIILAKAKRSERAKVAPALASKGYCASRGEFYYGVKIHVIGANQQNSIPFPESVHVTPAHVHDLTYLKEISSNLFNTELYADKAYKDDEFQDKMIRENNFKIITPVKKKKNGRDLNMFEKMDSAFISKLRQPIESLFNWINEKTGIQVASKVRSPKVYSYISLGNYRQQ